jgi:hypothetical protein
MREWTKKETEKADGKSVTFVTFFRIPVNLNSSKPKNYLLLFTEKEGSEVL